MRPARGSVTKLLSRLHAESDAFLAGTDPAAAERAMTWFQREKPSLVSALRSAGDDARTVANGAYRMMPFLFAIEDWQTIAEVGEAGVVAAGRMAAARRELEMLHMVGVARQYLNDDDRAVEIFTRVALRAAETGDKVLRAKSLAHHSQVMRRAGNLGKAASMLHEAASAYVGVDDRLGEARTLGDLAIALTELGDTDGAVVYAERARTIFRDLDDGEGEGRILRFLAIEKAGAGDLDQAILLLEQAARLFESASASALMVDALYRAAQMHWDNGDLESAVRVARSAVGRMPASARRSTDVAGLLYTAEIVSALRELVRAVDDTERADVLARNPILLDEGCGRLAANIDLISEAPDERARATATSAVAWLLAHRDGAAAGWYASEWDTVLQHAGTAADQLPVGLADHIRRYVASHGADRRELLEEIIAMLPGDSLGAVRGRYLLALARHDIDDVSDSPDYARIRANAAASAGLLAGAGMTDMAAEAYWLEGIAWRQDRTGDLRENGDRALRALRQALRLYRRSTHPYEWAVTIGNLGNVYWQYPDDRRRNLARAAARHAAALTVFTPDRYPEEWATGQANLGLVLSEPTMAHDPENLEKGCAHLSRALDGLTETRTRATVLLNLSRCHRVRMSGDRDANAQLALKYAHEAYALFENAGTPVELADAARAVADSMTSLGTSGDASREAIVWYRRALAMVSAERFPREHAALSDNLASTLAGATRPTAAEVSEAIALHHTAIDLYGSCGDAWELARARYKLARTILDTQPDPDLDEVLDLLERSLTECPVETAPIEWAHTSTALAWTLLRRGHDRDRERATALLQDVTGSTVLAGAPDEATFAWGLLGQVHARCGDWAAAATALNHAVTAAESRYAAAVLTTSRASELARLGGLPRVAAYALARAGDETAAVAVLESARARELGRLFDRDQIDLSTVDEVAPTAAAAYRDAVRRVAALEARQRVTPSPDRREMRQIHASLTDAHAMLRSATDAIRQVPAAGAASGRTTGDTVRQVVSAGCPLAYLIVTEHGSVALLATDTGVEAVFGSLTEQDLYTALATSGTPYSAEVLDLLGAQFLADLGQRLTDLRCGRVVLVPTGLLSILPVHAARYRRGKKVIHLLDEVAPSYTPSARALLAAHRASETGGSEWRLVAVADPVPDTAPLPWAREEAAALQRIFPGSSQCFTADAATKQALLAALPGATHLHLSCHGTYDADEPMESSLQLAHDEGLTLRELFEGQRLAGVQLVVASACDSAVSDVVRAPDEAIGLPAGLAYAGAHTIIGTLWAIADRSAELLISRFYVYHLLGDPNGTEGPMAPARALAKAQRWMRDAAPADIGLFTRDLVPVSTIDQFTGPAHWAAFVVYGVA